MTFHFDKALVKHCVVPPPPQTNVGTRTHMRLSRQWPKRPRPCRTAASGDSGGHFVEEMDSGGCRYVSTQMVWEKKVGAKSVSIQFPWHLCLTPNVMDP